MASLAWVDAGAVTGWLDGDTRTIVAGRRMILIVRTQDEFHAVEDRCTHDGAELAGGLIEGTEIICPRHGARFCLRTGEAMSPPAYEPIRVFETRIEAEHVWVRCD